MNKSLVIEIPRQPADYRLLIGGELRDKAGRRTIERRSPAHQKVVSIYPYASESDVDEAIAAARRAFDRTNWPTMPGAERGRLIQRVAVQIRERRDEFARIEAIEGGKLITDIGGEIDGSIELWEYAATLARHCYGDTYDSLGENTLGLVLRQPVGVVGMITPWNFPLLILSQKLPFALALGCTAVLKPSELTSGTSLLLGEILVEAGIPAGVVNIVAGEGHTVGAQICAHPDVDMVSFTGSTAVGRTISKVAADTLKRVSLELGGKSAHIVFADADLEAAADKVAQGVLINAGQCCVSGSRLLVQRQVAGEFSRMVAELMKSVGVGDPLDSRTRVGPVISRKQFDTISAYIASGKAQNATLMTGGGVHEEFGGIPGYFVEPTVFADVTPDMRIAQEEIFGPVLSIIPFDTVDEAIELANGTIYGLASGVWTRSIDTALRCARRIRAGTVEVNTYLAGAPELPLVGHGQSGIGHEKGRFAVDEFTALKTVQIQLGRADKRWTATEA